MEHFAGIRTALDGQGLWDETDGLFYDRLVTPSGYSVPVKTRSVVGIIPALAAAVVDGGMLQNAMTVNKDFTRFLRKQGVGDVQKLAETPQVRGEGASQRLLLSVAAPTPGWATRPRSRTCWIWASRRSSCCRCTRTCRRRSWSRRA